MTNRPEPPFLAAYLHVPFCRRKCAYCSFYSVAYSPRRAGTFLEALEKDLDRRARAAATVYLGGGTPTILAPRELRRLLAAARRAFPNADEFTVEANPETLDREKARILAEHGVNRVSLGLQTLRPDLLARIGRNGSPGHFPRALELLAAAGIPPSSVSCDLLYGIRGQRGEDLEEAVRGLAAAGVGHVSLYALSVEPGTRLARAREKATAAEGDFARHYLAAFRALEQEGYRRYEISNFARSGRRCRHNLNYWKGGRWQAFGPAATGEEEADRRYRILPDWKAYCAALEEGRNPPMNIEHLTPRQRREERLMLSLRLEEGADEATLAALGERALRRARRLASSGFLRRLSGRFSVPPEKAMLLDEITAEILAAT